MNNEINMTNSIEVANEELLVLKDSSGKEFYLEPRLSKLYNLLHKNMNQLISREKLIDEIWNDTIVNEESLNRAISDLRKTLKNSSNGNQILTIPKRGYKMVTANSGQQKSLKIKLFKGIAYTLAGLVILSLMLRGLNY